MFLNASNQLKCHWFNEILLQSVGKCPISSSLLLGFVGSFSLFKHFLPALVSSIVIPFSMFSLFTSFSLLFQCSWSFYLSLSEFPLKNLYFFLILRRIQCKINTTYLFNTKNIFHIFHTVAQFEFYTINMFFSLRSILYDNKNNKVAPVSMKQHLKSQNTKKTLSNGQFTVENKICNRNQMITISAARLSELILNELSSR